MHTLGEDIFDTLFHIKVRQPISLTFAIDYSGSMSDEIASVKERVIQLVTSTKESTNEPSDYVLTLFSDPGECHRTKLYVIFIPRFSELNGKTIEHEAISLLGH